MLAALAEITPPKSDGPQSLYYLILPLCLTILCALLAVAIIKWLGRALEQWLADSQRRRLFVSTIFAAIELVGIGVCIHAANFEAIFNGEVTWHRAVILSVIGGLTVVFFSAQILLHLSAEHSDEQQAAEVSNYKRALREAEVSLDAIKEDREFGIACNRVFLGRIDKIKARIKETVETAEADDRSIGIPGLIKALAPNLMVHELVITAYHIFDHQMVQKYGVIERTLRVALFRKNGDRLEHVFSFNGDTSDCVLSPIESPDRFALTQMLSCMAVATAWRSEVLVEEDAAAAHADTESPFNYFGNTQRQAIRSILTLPMSMNNEQPPVSYVMSIDTNRKGFFRKDQVEKYRVLADNLGRRLHLAYTMERLVMRISLETRR